MVGRAKTGFAASYSSAPPSSFGAAFASPNSNSTTLSPLSRNGGGGSSGSGSGDGGGSRDGGGSEGGGGDGGGGVGSYRAACDIDDTISCSKAASSPYVKKEEKNFV